MKEIRLKGIAFGLIAIFAIIFVIGVASVAGGAHTDENRLSGSMIANMHKKMHGDSDTSDHMMDMAEMHERMPGNLEAEHEGHHEMMEHMSGMSVEEMDKDNDGKCDMCEMLINLCPMISKD